MVMGEEINKLRELAEYLKELIYCDQFDPVDRAICRQMIKLQEHEKR